MKLTARTDIEAPVGYVFDCLADHPNWEREAVERGIMIERPADMPKTGLGAGWIVHLPYRGRLIKLLLRLVKSARDDQLGFDLRSTAVEGDLLLTVMALSPRRTRLQVQVEIRARTMAARLVLNTLRLAKGRVQARFDQRVQKLGMLIQNRFGRS